MQSIGDSRIAKTVNVPRRRSGRQGEEAAEMPMGDDDDTLLRVSRDASTGRWIVGTGGARRGDV